MIPRHGGRHFSRSSWGKQALKKDQSNCKGQDFLSLRFVPVGPPPDDFVHLGHAFSRCFDFEPFTVLSPACRALFPVGNPHPAARELNVHKPLDLVTVWNLPGDGGRAGRRDIGIVPD